MPTRFYVLNRGSRSHPRIFTRDAIITHTWPQSGRRDVYILHKVARKYSQRRHLSLGYRRMILPRATRNGTPRAYISRASGNFIIIVCRKGSLCMYIYMHVISRLIRFSEHAARRKIAALSRMSRILSFHFGGCKRFWHISNLAFNF